MNRAQPPDIHQEMPVARDAVTRFALDIQGDTTEPGIFCPQRARTALDAPCSWPNVFSYFHDTKFLDVAARHKLGRDGACDLA